MEMEGAIAAAAQPQPPVQTEDSGIAVITAEAFRKLTARLKAMRIAAPHAEMPPAGPIPVVPQPEIAEEPAAPPVEEAEVPVPEPEVPPARPPREPGEEAGDTAIRLLDLMAIGTGLLPQERVLAADTLLLLLPRMPARQLTRLAERVAIMDNPPPLLLAKLMRDPRPEIMAPVLERGAQVSDIDLIEAASGSDAERLRMIARRRVLSPELSSHLVSCSDADVILALLRNPGPICRTRLSRSSPRWRSRTPFCWHRWQQERTCRPRLPSNSTGTCRRNSAACCCRVSSPISTTLGRILRMALAEDGSLPIGALREERPAAGEGLDAALGAAAAGRINEAALRLGEIAGLAEGTVRRILADRHGEPQAVLFKTLGVGRSRFIHDIEMLRVSSALFISGEAGELQAVFDGLSFNMARMLITYWDWSTRRIGPYAPES